MRRDEGGNLLARTVCRLPSGHKHVPDGITIDSGEDCRQVAGQQGHGDCGCIRLRRGRQRMCFCCFFVPAQGSTACLALTQMDGCGWLWGRAAASCVTTPRQVLAGAADGELLRRRPISLPACGPPLPPSAAAALASASPAP